MTDDTATPCLLLIVPWLEMGGADKFNLDLLRQLRQRGWQVLIAATLPSTHPWLARFARYGQDIFLFDQQQRMADYPAFLRELIQTRGVDVVLIANSELGYLLLPYLRAECSDVTFVDFCHMEEHAWKRGGYPRMSVEHQDLLDLQLVSSDHLRGWMVDRGADPERIRVCYTNIDPAEWRPDPERRKRVRHALLAVPEHGQEDARDPGPPIILYAGRMCAQKQPRVFLETVRHLKVGADRFVAVVAGDGPEFARLRSELSRSGLADRVRLLGAVSNARIRDLMSAADIFFLPSRWEGIAVSIFEAMACGLPVVGADVGGQRELLTPECGLLVSPGPAGTGSAARQYAPLLADLLSDPQRRAALGRAARQRVCQHFRLEQMGERMAGVLQEARDLHISQPRPLPDAHFGQLRAARTVRYLRFQALVRRLVSPTIRAALDKKLHWLLPVRETAERVLLREVWRDGPVMRQLPPHKTP